MNHPTYRITHTTAFVTPVVDHWLEREIAQWNHPMKDRSNDPSHHKWTLLPRSYISLPCLLLKTSMLLTTLKMTSKPTYHLELDLQTNGLLLEAGRSGHERASHAAHSPQWGRALHSNDRPTDHSSNRRFHRRKQSTDVVSETQTKTIRPCLKDIMAEIFGNLL